MKILGIDPGLARIGYGVIENQKNKYSIIEAGLITTPSDQELPQRLQSINKDIKKVLKKHQLDYVGIEKLFFFKNAKTAFSVGQAWGVITFTVATMNLPIIELTPLQIKQSITGYGQATKEQVQKMILPIFKLRSAPKPDDVADAVACAFCAGQYLNIQKNKNSKSNS